MSRIIEITGLEHPELDVYTKLAEPQLLHYYEPDLGILIAESVKVVERALDAGYEAMSYFVEKEKITDRLMTCVERSGDIPVYVAEYKLMKELTGYAVPQGVLCAMRRKRIPTVEELLGDEAKASFSRIAVVEDVTNPTNIGAIFRSAAALGIDAVLLTSSCADPLYRRAIRVSMGNVFLLPWTYLPKHGNYVEELQKLGYATAAMALEEDSVSIDDPNLMAEEKLAIILGNEGEGLCVETIEKSNYTVMIPMAHGVDSLNVAAASAVAFWQLAKRE